MAMSIACFKSSERRKRNKRLWSCHGRTHTHGAHSREKVVPSNMCSFVGTKRLERRPPGASVQTCLGILGGDQRQDHAADRVTCAVTSMVLFSICDTHGLTRTVTGIPYGMDSDGTETPNRSTPSLDRLLLFPPWWPFALTDYRGGRPTPPDLGFATRSSVPAIL
jgi:hypothetical protein